MRKKIALLLVLLAVISVTVFATEEERKDRYNIYIGSGIYVSQLGFSRDFGKMEVGLNFNSGFPNLFLYSLLDLSDEEDKGSQIIQNLKDSFTLAYAGDIFFKYDVSDIDNLNIDLSVGLAGIYSGDFLSNQVMAGFIEIGSRFMYLFNGGKGGIYLETNVPLYALIKTTNSSGESETQNAFLIGDDIGALALITGLFCTRVGYKISF